MRPRSGRKAHSLYTCWMLLWSAMRAEHGRGYAPHAQRGAEEKPRDEAQPAREQLLGVHEDGREGRGEHEADEDREYGGPEKRLT